MLLIGIVLMSVRIRIRLSILMPIQILIKHNYVDPTGSGPSTLLITLSKFTNFCLTDLDRTDFAFKMFDDYGSVFCAGRMLSLYKDYAIHLDAPGGNYHL